MKLKLIFLSWFMISLFFSFSAEKTLKEADSLFAQQKYTEAYQRYEILLVQGKYTPAMLLKMAFINDGLGNYVEALYFLDLYYKKSADRNVLEKINEISQNNRLHGYVYHDSHFFLALIEKFSLWIQLAMSSILFLTAVYIYRKRRLDQRPTLAYLLHTFTGLLFLLLASRGGQNRQGVIYEDSTLLRSGPSAGAEPIEVISKGHKVDILKELPAWTKIMWEGNEVYVRKDRVKII